jgi:hypothetical protein
MGLAVHNEHDLDIAAQSQNHMGFDGYDMDDVPLGDLMRGERATLGKSFLDIERETKIRASYIAAIEDGNADIFTAPAFVSGYVKAYARCLGMDPDWAFARFCKETNFTARAQSAHSDDRDPENDYRDTARLNAHSDFMRTPRINLEPANPGILSYLQPAAVGSGLVIVLLLLGIGYGAWAVFQDIQRLQIAPLNDAPVPMAQIDPISQAPDMDFASVQGWAVNLPGTQALDRLYRPQALDVPILTPRDSAISTLNPDEVGVLGQPSVPAALGPLNPARDISPTSPRPQVQVTQPRDDAVVLFAVRPSWVQVRTAGGSIVFEGTLNAGESYAVPLSDTPPVLRAGNSGSLYFAVNGETLGPVGRGTSIVDGVEMAASTIAQTYDVADALRDPDLSGFAALVLQQDSSDY